MAIFGPRFDTAAANAFGRTFDPLAWQKNQREKEIHEATMSKLKNDTAFLQSLMSTEETTEAFSMNQEQGYSVIKEVQRMASLPNTIRKPSLNAWVNSIEARTGKPVSPYLKEVLQKGDPEELSIVMSNLMSAAADTPDFGIDGLIEMMGSDQKVMQAIIPAAEGVTKPSAAEPGTQAQPGDDGFVPDPARVAEMKILDSQIRNQQTKVASLERNRNLGIGGGISKEAIGLANDLIKQEQTKLDEMKKRRQKLSDDISGRRTSLQDDATKRKAEEQVKINEELREEGRDPDLLKTGSLIRETREKLRDRNLTDEQREELRGQLSDLNLQYMSKAAKGTQTALPPDSIKPSNMPATQDTMEEMNQKIIDFEAFVLIKQEIEAILQGQPASKTWVADAVRLGQGIQANIAAILPGYKMHINDTTRTVTSWDEEGNMKILHLDPDNFDWSGFEELGAKSAQIRSAYISGAFHMAFLRGQTGKALSDNDLKLFFKELGASEQNPKNAMHVLNSVQTRLEAGLKQEWKRKMNDADGNPIPWPDDVLGAASQAEDGAVNGVEQILKGGGGPPNLADIPPGSTIKVNADGSITVEPPK